MATKKDLVEAYSFSRRRLVTAFVSGAPGGREVEPARPGRAVIGGIAIAILLLAGAAVLNALGSTVSFDRTTPQLLSEKESGADYVLIAPAGSEELELRPVINITSAMLLLGADIEPLVVSRETLSELTPGAQIGILQAPATPPPVDGLITSGWTACTGEVAAAPVGLKVNVTPTPAVVATPGVSFVVRSTAGAGAGGKALKSGTSGETLYLVAESPRGTQDGRPRAHVYEVPDDADSVLSAVASSSAAEAVDVPADWLTTFPQGSALTLETFGLTRRDVGRALPSQASGGSAAGLQVGDVVEVGTRSYLLTPRGQAVFLDAFMREVYLAVVPDGRQPKPGELPPGVEIASNEVFDGSRWPVQPTTELPNGELCSLLSAAPGVAPSVVLASALAGGEASAEGVDAGQAVASVDAGAGAFVRSGGWSDVQAPTRMLLDDRALAYGVAGETEADHLGYDGVPPVVVPDSWLELFNPGVLLSLDAARCAPTSQTRAAPCS